MLRDKVFRVRSNGKVTMHHPTPYARVHVSNPRAGNVTFGRTLEDAWPLAAGATLAVPGKPRARPEIRCWSEKFEVGGRQELANDLRGRDRSGQACPRRHPESFEMTCLSWL